MNIRRRALPAVGIILLILVMAALYWSRKSFPRSTVPDAKSETESPVADTQVLAWFEAAQGKGSLIPSNENTTNAYTYDQALAVITFTIFDRRERAERILDFFEAKAVANFEGFKDFYPVGGAETADPRAGGPNGWILIAINNFTARTGDRKYLPLGRKIADWLLTLQTREGGIAGGYNPWGEPMGWVSTEHNLDCFSAFRDFAVLTGETKYRDASVRILRWLRAEAYAPEFPHPRNGRHDPNFATDVVSWGILSLGGRLGETIRHAEVMARTSHSYLGKEVVGFDFGGAYKDTTWPDRDAVWFEGTGQMACAYQLLGKSEEARACISELEKALAPSARFPGAMGLTYASNNGTPAYGSWEMFSEWPCISSGAWYLFAKRGLNPFSAFDNTDRANEEYFRASDDFVSSVIPPVREDFSGVTSLTLAASYMLREKLSDHASIRLDTMTGSPLARIDFNPMYSASAGADRDVVPEARFTRTLVGETVSVSEYRSLDVTFFADGSGNRLTLDIISNDSFIELASWNLDQPGWNTASAPLPPVSAISGWRLTISGRDPLGSTIMIRDIRLGTKRGEALPLRPLAAIRSLKWNLLTGFESDTILFSGGTIGTYGAAETRDWKDPASKSWFITPVDVGYDFSLRRRGIQSFRAHWNGEKADWASFSLDLGPVNKAKGRRDPADLSAYTRLVFWVRGEKGGERFQVMLRSASAPTADPDIRGPVFVANPCWTRCEVDLTELLRGRSARIETINLALGGIPLGKTDRGAILTDDWWLGK